MKRTIDVLVDDHPVRSVEVTLVRLPSAQPLTDAEWISEAVEALWFESFEIPANAAFQVRQP